VKVVIDEAAQHEMQEAALFYENCREGLGLEFLNAVDFGLNQVRLHPNTWRKLKGRFRRYLLNRFPYALIYTIEDDTVYVAAIMHLKRKPGYWWDRGKDKEIKD